MPLYYFKCETCGAALRKIMAPEQAREPRICVCGEVLSRDPHPPSSQAVETLDNGIMPRRLERLADAERLFAERYVVTEKKRQGE